MIKILNIGHSETGGGLQTVFRITNNINSDNVKMFTAFNKSEGSRDPDIALKKISDYINPFKKILTYFFIPQNYYGIKNFLLNNKVDVIHLHGSVNLSLGVIMAIKRYKKDAKVVLTSHGYGLVCPVYSCFSSRKGTACTECVDFGREIRVIKNKCHRKGYLYSAIRYLDFLINKRITNNYSLYDCIITPSEYLKKTLKKSRHKFKNIKVVSNPIQMDYHKDLVDKDNEITYMGRFSPEKNVDLLIDSFAQIIEDKKYQDLKLNIIGAGPDLSKYQKKISELGIESNVYISEKFLGKEELMEKVEKSKILVLPSIFPETFGLVLLEGVRLGLIPIAFKIGAQAENIRNLGFGYLYENNQVEDLAFAIKKNLNEYDKIIKGLDKVNEKVDEFFSLDSYYKNLVSLYYEVC